MRSISESQTRAAPLTIGAGNSVAMTGLSWAWIKRFARTNQVPLWQVAARKQVVPGAPLLAALERAAAASAAAAPAREPTDEQALATLRRKYGLELRPGIPANDTAATAREARR